MCAHSQVKALSHNSAGFWAHCPHTRLNMDNLEQASQVIDSLSLESFGDDHVKRMQVLDKARALCSRLETDWEALTRIMWLNVRAIIGQIHCYLLILWQPSISVAIKLCSDLDIFSQLERDGPGKSSNELAKATGAEPLLLGRLLRLLGSCHVVTEVDTDRFAANHFSNALTRPGYKGGMSNLFSSVWPVFTKMPEFFRQNGYRSPHNPSDGPFQFAKETDLHQFQWMKSHPAEAQAFGALMAEFHGQRHYWWTSFYPTSRLTEPLLENSDSQAIPLIVDVGGGVGRDMENLRQYLLPKAYNIVVQDLPHVVEQGAKLYPSLKFMSHELFHEQPIQKARAYFMQNVLHDWPDEKAREILRNVAKACRPGFSTLLLCETVMPEKGIRPTTGAIDVVMMAFLCAQERSEEQWKSLLESAGYRIKHIWRASISNRCVIEAEPEDVDL